MKQLTLIVHTEMQKALTDQLRNLSQVRGFTFGNVEGRGSELENDAFLSARDKVVGYTPRLRADVLLEDSDIDGVLEALRQGLPAAQGRLFYWVTPVERSGHF